MYVQAKVNQGLLTKATRFFTGTKQGRLVEVLQNSRRGNASEVSITNGPDTPDGKRVITVRDNGDGIQAFDTLLCLGKSDWNENLVKAEDVAGIGLFCLAPGTVTIRSRGQRITIGSDEWVGIKPAKVETDSFDSGTELTFTDEIWSANEVHQQSRFSGLRVIVDGAVLEPEPFITGPSVHYRDLGANIAVLSQAYNHDNVNLNFHGQAVSFGIGDLCDNAHEYFLYRIDLTGEPTPLQFLLPARTTIVRNQGYERLKEVLEFETYRFLQTRGWHKLSYAAYKRGRALGFDLPEAKQCYSVGLLHGDLPEPTQIDMPREFSLSQCFMVNEDEIKGDPQNVHLLAVYGEHSKSFVPVKIRTEYREYSWAQIPRITKTEVVAGAITHADHLNFYEAELVIVETLRIRALASNGSVFESAVPIAVVTNDDEETIYLTRDAENNVSHTDIWFLAGGFNDNWDADSYDSQDDDFSKDLDEFWAAAYGENELVRRRIHQGLLDSAWTLRDLWKGDYEEDWQEVTVSSDGTVQVKTNRGKSFVLKPQAD